MFHALPLLNPLINSASNTGICRINWHDICHPWLCPTCIQSLVAIFCRTFLYSGTNPNHNRTSLHRRLGE
ncbi:hypothetical protein KM043_011768 [Ampulex compressa]|nr:hypothetical protein KM043_011768 [Ampulex compressa]